MISVDCISNLVNEIDTRLKFFKKGIVVWGRKNLVLSKDAIIHENVIIRCRANEVRIGAFSGVGPFSVIFSGDDGVDIGEYVMIGPHCVIAGSDHNHRLSDKPMRMSGSISKGSVVIEDDVWIGSHVTITSGVKIAKGCVIGANSVVTKDTKPYSVYCGVPAQFIRERAE